MDDSTQKKNADDLGDGNSRSSKGWPFSSDPETTKRGESLGDPWVFPLGNDPGWIMVDFNRILLWNVMDLDEMLFSLKGLEGKACLDFVVSSFDDSYLYILIWFVHSSMQADRQQKMTKKY